MKLQRYEPHIYASLLGDSRILFEASDTGEWVKADEALAETARLSEALNVISDFDCDCFEDDSCGVCLARLALEGK
jgi:hypothetical protein